MARIAGVDIPREKHVEISLTYIYGIGRTVAKRALAICKIAPNRKVSALTEDEVNRLREVVERQFIVEGDLRRIVRQNIQRLIDIGCYRGYRCVVSAPGRMLAPDAGPKRPSARVRRRRLRSSLFLDVTGPCHGRGGFRLYMQVDH
jgi:small subunit ribosomal protein S13